jgi:hypothetical protein
LVNIVTTADYTTDYNNNHRNEDNDLNSHDMPSTCSMQSSESINDRPLSIMSNGTVKSSGSKNRFNFFGSSKSKKEKRTSISLSFSRSTSNPPSIASPTTPSYTTANMDFEDLMRSGNTKKVSLTPNRLRSIEVKNDNVTPWDKFTNGSKNNDKSKSKKRSSEPFSFSSSPLPSPPPIPPLPRLNRDQHYQIITHTPTNPNTTTTTAAAVVMNTNINKNNSPPLTPASSVASRPSQRSRHSIIYEEKFAKSSMKSSYSTNEDLLVDGTTNLMRNTSKMSTSSSVYSRRSAASGVERPSSMVVKRTSLGSRPPSFHENALDTLIAAANGFTLEEKVSQVDQEQHNLIYVLPTSTARSPISSRFVSSSLKVRTVNRGCQTDPIGLYILHKNSEVSADDEEEDEEWFFDEDDEDEEAWNSAQQEEKIIVEWLLGNV